MRSLPAHSFAPTPAPLSFKRSISADDIRARLPPGRAGMGFIFHATDWESLGFSFNNVPPRSVALEQLLWETAPFIASPVSLNGQVIGANIVCPVPLELWMGRASTIKQFRQRQLFPALALARRAGLNMVALGASMPYACNYGTLPRVTPTPSITTGHAATAAVLKEWTIHCCAEVGVPFGLSKIALFGAAGRMGMTAAAYLCHAQTPRELILIDLPDKLSLLHKQAADLRATMPARNMKISVHTYDRTVALPAFDGAILVSCTSTPYLSADDLRRAQFWIDDSHPRAATVEAELAARGDTLYIECFLRGPRGLDIDYAFKLPSQQDCYTCFAEGYVAWAEQIDSDFVTSSPPVWTVAYTHSLLKKHGFQIGPFVGKNGALLAVPRHAASALAE